jgi:hypothetical protein
MSKRIGRSGAWGFPVGGHIGTSTDAKIRKVEPAAYDPRTAPLPEHGVVEQIDPDQRRRQVVWALEEDLPEPNRYATLMREFMSASEGRAGEVDLDADDLSDDQRQRLARLLADEAALVAFLTRTESLRLEIRLRVASERPS